MEGICVGYLLLIRICGTTGRVFQVCGIRPTWWMTLCSRMRLTSCKILLNLRTCRLHETKLTLILVRRVKRCRMPTLELINLVFVLLVIEATCWKRVVGQNGCHRASIFVFLVAAKVCRDRFFSQKLVSLNCRSHQIIWSSIFRIDKIFSQNSFRPYCENLFSNVLFLTLFWIAT